MIYLLALLAGLLGTVPGALLGLLLGGLLVPILGISSFEGGSGYFVVSIALAGALLGFVAGIALTLLLQGGFRGFGAVSGRLALVLGAAAALIFAGIQIRLTTQENFRGGSPQMHFEIRLPAGMAAPQRQQISFEMQAGSQYSGGFLNDSWLRQDGERAVLSGHVPLYTRTSQRFFVVRLPDRPKLLFVVGLAATPKVSDQFGAWQRVNYIDDGNPDSQPRPPNNDEAFDIRVKVPEWRH